MIKRQLEIINKTGLHARPASEFVLLAKKFESKVTIAKEGGEAVNAKSMVRLLAESIGQGCKVDLVVDGADEEQAMEELAKLIESGFGE
ncbi:MAG: HPr family phosphocarrier protein [Lachnospiraceae bacterium]|nr:HPr family phosphocarrier protein [Lachnospiraceae bacterium]MBQ9122274.1 HPr family phosphocarrier protein [Lachnospiraceae bacterium]